MSGNNSGVSVFHFTSRISNAKIRKYKMATERGMGPSPLNPETGHGRPGSEQPARFHESPTPPMPVVESSNAVPSPTMPPPAKRARLKLNVREPRSSQTDQPGSSSQPAQASSNAVRTSPRQKRKASAKSRYSQDKASEEPKPPPAKKAKASPAPSSELSSLASDREESPFIDPPADPVAEDYGDFMSYYVDVGPEEEKARKESKAKAKTKSRARSSTSKAEPESTKQQEPPPVRVEPERTKVEPKPAQAQQPAQQPHGVQQAPPPQPPPQQRPPPPPQQQRPGPQHPPPPFHQGPPMSFGPPVMPPPPQIPEPRVKFEDIRFAPKPLGPVSFDQILIQLDCLSNALSKFQLMSDVEPPQPAGKAKSATPKTVAPKPVAKKSKPAPKPKPTSTNEVDFLLSHFDDDDDDDDLSEESVPIEVVPRKLGVYDGDLIHGIQFIQNAMDSWGKQRMTKLVTEQWQMQQLENLRQQHLNAQRRGPGRPRRYQEPDPLGPPPVILIDFGTTDEGAVIYWFQVALDAGAFQVNGVMPAEMSRALRKVYMQIDHLINRAPNKDANWQPMSYSAQIRAHQVQLAKMKEAQKLAREETERQQRLANEQMMAKMGLQPHQMGPMTPEQVQQAHAIDLERRRSMQHAAQQPYISEQHLNPLQLGSPAANGPSPPPSRDVPSASNAHAHQSGEASADSPPNANEGIQAEGADANGGGQVQLDKMKLYMPGFLPRSGQSMKFSFAPNSDVALRVFGSESFPTNEPSSKLPNRGPMSAPPTASSAYNGHAGGSNGVSLEGTPKALGGDPASPIKIDSDTTAEQAFGTEDVHNKSEPPVDHSRPATAGPSGFNAINAPVPRPQPAPSDSPDTIRVAMRHPSAPRPASESPAPGSVSPGKIHGVPRVTNFPVAPTVVLDK